MRDTVHPGEAAAAGPRAKLGWALLIAGGGLLVLAAGVRLVSSLESAAGLERFRQASAESAGPGVRVARWEPIDPDRSAWAPGRVAAWKESRTQDMGMPLGVLRIARLDLEVPIWQGTEERALNRGLGLIAGTDGLGGSGNIGIAGHRDGFFRVLEGIKKGDEIDVEMLAGVRRFAVTDVWIVTPESVWVLDPTPYPSLTLVTCYPFYFVGKAPSRFVVRARATAGQLRAEGVH
ncbi:MAG TPA: sortase [Thermoanaerobaculia bacterium]|nr:sortase [Thermoanaerobaculia bacterium]